MVACENHVLSAEGSGEIRVARGVVRLDAREPCAGVVRLPDV
ncbi:MAG: hypothetical protein QOH50_2770 [Kribbellaceae bacterium]|jgi:hypothetical protein|nr:hypothetical protein [Kribbellaceae bacterium]